MFMTNQNVYFCLSPIITKSTRTLYQIVRIINLPFHNSFDNKVYDNKVTNATDAIQASDDSTNNVITPNTIIKNDNNTN